jgi:hypothetical protein
MAKRGLIISTGTAGSGVNSYIDLENRPDDIIDTTVSPATTTGGLKLIYPSPFILSVLNVPLPPHALLVLIVVSYDA